MKIKSLNTGNVYQFVRYGESKNRKIVFVRNKKDEGAFIFPLLSYKIIYELKDKFKYILDNINN